MTEDRMRTIGDSQICDHLLSSALEDIRRGKELPMGFIGNVLNEARVEIERLRGVERAVEDVLESFWLNLEIDDDVLNPDDYPRKNGRILMVAACDIRDALKGEWPST